MKIPMINVILIIACCITNSEQQADIETHRQTHTHIYTPTCVHMHIHTLHAYTHKYTHTHTYLLSSLPGVHDQSVSVWRSRQENLYKVLKATTRNAKGLESLQSVYFLVGASFTPFAPSLLHQLTSWDKNVPPVWTEGDVHSHKADVVITKGIQIDHMTLGGGNNQLASMMGYKVLAVLTSLSKRRVGTFWGFLYFTTKEHPCMFTVTQCPQPPLTLMVLMAIYNGISTSSCRCLMVVWSHAVLGTSY